MSDSDAVDGERAMIELSRKLRQYAYLLPPPSALMMDKMTMGDGGVPDADADASPAPPSDPRIKPADWPALGAAAARDRALGCLLGLAVGDAVGTSVEFKERGSFPDVTDMVGGGPFRLAPGEWTDDTTMALCLADTLLATGTVDQPDFMARLHRWFEAGENTVPGRCFDIGGTTETAIARYASDGIASAGSEAPETAGNGSLVRLAPLAILTAGTQDEARLLARKQSRATHATIECLDACALFVSYLDDALTGADKDGATRQRVMALAPNVLFISAGEWRDKPREQIRSSGYVVHTLEAALWAVWHTDNFRDAVLTAVNLGDDADSVGAVAGQLAGALYGASAIPAEWLSRLAWRDKIEGLAARLFERRLAVKG